MPEIKKNPDRKSIQKKDQWDLSRLFNNDNEWEDLYSHIEKDIEKYNNYNGRLDDSIKLFKEAIDFDLDISRSIDRLYTYAHLKSDEDKTEQYYIGMLQKIMALYTKASSLASFMNPEIQALPSEIIAKYKKDPELEDYHFYLEKILRWQKYTLSKEVEQILAFSSEIAHAPSQIFSQLDNADMKFNVIEDDKGNQVELSHGNFSTFLMSPDPAVRKNAFHTYYSSYDDHKYTIAQSLVSSLKKDYFYAQVRKFENCRAFSLFSDDVEADVYDNLIETVKANLQPVFDFLNFKKEIFGLKDFHFYDTYPSVIREVDFHMPYEEAVEVCVKALEPLGQEYNSVLKEGLLNGWVDRYENKGKRSGAYSSGCYDSEPHILLNYKDDNINSIFTLIHEAGHSMHSYLSNKNQPYMYHSYTIFVAEVASTFNETLLSNYLLDLYKDQPDMRLYILNREIDNIRATVVRQTMFAEFEKISHQYIENNQPLTLDSIREIYQSLLKIYFGDSIIIDPELTLECLRIPHFYSPFYVYKYATGISAALELVRRIQAGENGAVEDYLKFLKTGSSMFPLGELKAAGVDMSKPKPVVSALNYLAERVSLFKEEYSKYKS